VADNEKIAHRFHMEIFQAGKLDVADELVASNFVAHSPGGPEVRGPDGVKQWAQAIRSGLPDIRLSHEHAVSQGEHVVIRWSGKGTHKGEMFGVPASGKPVAITGFDEFRIQNGKIVEMWQNWDALGFMQQVGAVPGQQ
jgi:steroid delta-isomerase-like uncharacterized protein